MNIENFIKNLSMTLYKKINLYSAGPEIVFNKPCIGYIKKGYAKFFYKGKTSFAYEGDLIYIALGTKYQSVWFGDPDVEWYSISFDFTSKNAFSEYPFQILRNYPSETLDKMFEAYEKEPLLSISYFYMLLNDIFQKMKKIKKNPVQSKIEKAIEHIENNYADQISIEYLASICYMSESSFFKAFKRATGVTPIAYKHNIMIQTAIEMLSGGNISIEEVSTLCGFSSSNYFRRIFIRLTGKTPKEIRKNI
ncbi:MAG: helix-turn-helix transcriptional regulator [Clostridia bacterium]|nr:helix-turn-helix transcriptional regulator [Clostridia bacterium]